MKAKFIVPIIVTILISLLIGEPTKIQPILKDYLPKLVTGSCSLNFEALIQMASLGTIVFMLSIIGRFEEHKISYAYRNQFNKHINLLTHLSNISISYFVNLVILLVVYASYSEPVVTESLKMLIYSLLMITNFYILLLIGKIMIFEELLDNYQIKKRLKDIGFDNNIMEALSKE